MKIRNLQSFLAMWGGGGADGIHETLPLNTRTNRKPRTHPEGRILETSI